MSGWGGWISTTLIVIGVAIVCSVLGIAHYRVGGVRGMRKVMTTPIMAEAMFWGFALFSLGFALGNRIGWWMTALWAMLSIYFIFDIWRVRRLRHAGEQLSGTADEPPQANRRLALTLVALGMLFAIAYGLVILPWMQPDEPRHFEVALHVARLGKLLPTSADLVPAWEQEIIADMEDHNFWWYGFSLIGWDPNSLPGSFAEIWGSMYSTAFFQPPLYYIFGGGLMSLLGPDAPLDEAVLWLRVANVVLLGLSLWGVYKLMLELFPARSQLALAILAWAALWPSHLAANAAVNNDPLVEMFTIWTLFYAIRLLRRGPDLSTIAWLFSLSLLALSSKRTGLLAVAAVVLTLFLWGFGVLAQNRKRKAMVLAGGGLLFALVAGGWMIWLALRTGRLGIPQTFVSDLLSGAYGQELAQAPLNEFANAMFRTFIGWFGWMRVPLPEPFYWIGGIAILLALAALLVALFKGGFSNLAGWQKRGLLLLLAAFAVQLLLVTGKELVYGTWRDGSLPQARYLYPILPAIFLFLAMAFASILPPRWRTYALPAGIAVLLGFNLYVLGAILYPFFWL